MYDYKEEDKKLFIQELLVPWRMMVALAAIAFPFMSQNGAGIVITAIVWAGLARFAFNESTLKRFKSKRFSALWKGILDRSDRLDTVLKGFRGERLGNLNEMEDNIKRTQESLYRSLRRADYITREYLHTEANAAPPIWNHGTQDSQSRELYQMADKSIAEYKLLRQNLMGSVDRTEAQCAVFMTTVDVLRMKMLNHRLSGTDASVPMNEFLSTLAEARLQLDTIDRALEEINFDAYPTQLESNLTRQTPPPLPPDAKVANTERVTQDE